LSRPASTINWCVFGDFRSPKISLLHMLFALIRDTTMSVNRSVMSRTQKPTANGMKQLYCYTSFRHQIEIIDEGVSTQSTIKPCRTLVMLEKQSEDQCSTLRFLVTTMRLSVFCTMLQVNFITYPSSKCLQRLRASCAFVLHVVHSNRNTIFFVVFAFLWNTGFV